MGRQRVYIESTIVSYVVAKPSRDILLSAQQQLTRKWWHNSRRQFSLFVSRAVIDEIQPGDPQYAARRLDLIADIPILPTDAKIIDVAMSLVKNGPLPEKATADAFHLATATRHGIDILLTWNCRHLANAMLLPRVRKILSSSGLVCPEVCTVNELIGS